ncbi:MAG: universal stress protein [Deltaproteobacteria bacterium]|nr:universal stress protein [Deltaproteobacteria bacterium]
MIPQIKKILYCTDLSKNSSYAFLFAIDMAKKHNAKIVVIHAIDPVPSYVELYTGLTAEKRQKQQEEMVEYLKKHLQGFCKKAEAQIGLPCSDLVSNILVSIAHPPEAILHAADEEDCDVIVLGTHGKGFLTHTFLGTVSHAVLYRTRKPVFIIPLPSGKTPFDWDGI